jgi:hypothetical protein
MDVTARATSAAGADGKDVWSCTPGLVLSLEMVISRDGDCEVMDTRARRSLLTPSRRECR